jgi:hypothetical protein
MGQHTPRTNHAQPGAHKVKQGRGGGTLGAGTPLPLSLRPIFSQSIQTYMSWLVVTCAAWFSVPRHKMEVGFVELRGIFQE